MFGAGFNRLNLNPLWACRQQWITALLCRPAHFATVHNLHGMRSNTAHIGIDTNKHATVRMRGYLFIYLIVILAGRYGMNMDT